MEYNNLFEKYKKELFDEIYNKCNYENIIGPYSGGAKYLIEIDGKKVYVTFREINWFYQMTIAEEENLFGSTNHLVLIRHTSGVQILGYVKRSIGSFQKPEVVLRADSTQDESKDFYRNLSNGETVGVSIKDDIDPFFEMAKANRHEGFLNFYNNIRCILGLEEKTIADTVTPVSPEPTEENKAQQQEIITQQKIIEEKEGIISFLRNFLTGSNKRDTNRNKGDK